MHSWVYCVDGTACGATRYNPRFALLAQLAEQLTLNQRVVGSNPTQGINAPWRSGSWIPISLSPDLAEPCIDRRICHLSLL